ncbi:MAG: glycosyltransferase family 39 protein, partial [Acidobacteriota bacterium]
MLLAVLLLAFALRMARVGELRMWGDEAYSVYSAHRSLVAITFEGAENDPHPPLYYYLLHFYMRLAGASELALRFFSGFAGVATVALVYVTGKRLLRARVGWLAALFAAVAPFDVYYSQEIRMYALAIFLTTLALYFFVRWWEGEREEGRGENHPYAIWYAAAMLLALYSLYHTAFIFVAEGIFLLFFWRTRRRFILRWLAVSAVVVLLFLPWLALRFSSTLGHLEDRAGHTIQSLPVFAARGFAALTAGATIPPANALVLSAAFLAVLLAGLLIAIKSRRITARDGLVLLLAAVPIVAVYPLYLLLPILVARLFALAFVPLALLLARGLDLLGEANRGAAALGAVALLGICAYSLNDYYFRFDRYNAAAEDYIPVVRAVEEQARAGDVVLFHAYWQMGYFLSHYAGPPLEYRLLDNERDLNQAISTPRNVWAVIQGLDLTGSKVWLAQHAFAVSNLKFGEMRLDLYRAGTPERGSRFEPPILFGNGMALVGYHINREPVESGRGLATVQLDWQATQKINDDYTVSVRLTDARGQAIRAQEDNQPADGTRPTSTWEPGQVVEDRHAFGIPPGTPPGDYGIQVVVYQSAGGRAANIVAPDNARGQALALAPLEVSRPEAAVPVRDVPKGFDARWNEIALAGFESSADEMMPGDTLLLTLYWQARTRPVRRYRAGFLILDSDGGWRSAAASLPGGDALPTTAWSVGETWIDKVPLTLDAGAAAGAATVYVYVQDEASDETVPVRTDALPRDLTIKGRFGGNT